MSSHQEFKFEDDSTYFAPIKVNEFETRTIDLESSCAPVTMNIHFGKVIAAIGIWSLAIAAFFFNPIIAIFVLALAVYVTIATKLMLPAEKSSHFSYNQAGWTLAGYSGKSMSATWDNTKGFEIRQKGEDFGTLTLEAMDGKKLTVQIDFPHKSRNVQDFLEVIENYTPASRYRRYFFLNDKTILRTVPIFFAPTLIIFFQLLSPASNSNSIVNIFLLASLVLSLLMLVIGNLWKPKSKTKTTTEPVICNIENVASEYFTAEIPFSLFVCIFLYFIFARADVPDPIKVLFPPSFSILLLAGYLAWKTVVYPYKMYNWSAYVTEGTLVLKSGKQTIREYITDLEISPAKSLAGSPLIRVQGKSITVFLCNSTDTKYTLTELIEGIKAGKTYPPKMSALHPGFNIKYNDAEEDSKQ